VRCVLKAVENCALYIVGTVGDVCCAEVAEVAAEVVEVAVEVVEIVPKVLGGCAEAGRGSGGGCVEGA